MIIGHLPAGYLLTRWFSTRAPLRACNSNVLMAAGLLGSVFPDFDMLYFYLVDHRQTHHHLYWTHWPVFWVAVLAISAVVLIALKRRAWLLIAGVFVTNVFVHLMLDTIVGDVWWLAPFVNQPFALFTVPAIYKPWWLNFILHGSFLLELVIVVIASSFLRAR